MSVIAKLQLSAFVLVSPFATALAQDPAPAATVTIADSTAVTDVVIKSGRIGLSSIAHPKPAFIPDGSYKNEVNTILVIVDGRIVRVQPEVNEATDVASVRLSRKGIVVLTPSTNALMAVTDIALPDGTFKTEDGAWLFTVVNGRPHSFTVPADSVKR